MAKTFIRTEFFSEFDHPHPKVDFSDAPSMTRQEFADEANVNNLLKRYAQTGSFYDPTKPHSARQPLFGDFSKYNDFTVYQNLVIEARDRFDSLPVEIREKFNYDPAKLLDFLADEKNRDEAIKLNLIAKAAAAATPESANAAPAAANKPTSDIPATDAGKGV